ncbi:chromatin remodelling complex Rsc7/Swp82 subunit-domain-containing protein [Mycena maculata]|uniref:Chromatin remodelling complex Rsc7/Swp82 subunit-domain-containing protein n=1 Tax=Mycena maculata TaxID=230809 RepID=A0AAD7JHG0_9AGAR|nr:chromatin remodelling complex Rsc7/Swp82 subunit-domain-containing protein [Mycena maculata]
MSALPKIIIKPRSSLQSRSLPPSPQEEEGDADAEDEPDDAPTPMDVDAEAASASEGGAAQPVKRGRGRPRGRGKSQPTSGTSTPRGRGRGRGTRGARPRGTGRTILGSGALTIRLPKRPEEEEEEEDLADGDVGTEGDTGAEEKEKEPVAPLGGGKPFRKIQGKAYVIEGDEFITEDDPKGNEKIDKWGNLLGGRRFKAATFILPGRHPERRYMLAIDAARTSGFRDSLYYFRRNPLAFKQNATQPEKDYLISQAKLGPHLRTRSVTLVTARSAFKLHGSKMIIDGKWVVDDYYEEKSLEEITARGLKAGDPVGELPDPNGLYHANEPANPNPKADKNDRGGGLPMGLYRAGGPTTIFGSSGWGPFSDGPLNAVRKSLLSRDGVSEENWMWMAATRTLAAGEEWARWRKEGVQPMDLAGNIVKGKRKAEPDDEQQEGASSGKKPRPELTDDLPLGVYEAHSGVVQYRADTQPTRSRMEALPDSDAKSVLGGTKVGNGAWAVAWLDTIMEVRTPEELDRPDVEEKHRLWKEAEASAGALDPT